MRIKDVSKPAIETSRIAVAEDRRSGGQFNHEFQRHMAHLDHAEHEKYVKELSQQITRQGEIVSQKVDLAEFQKYRELITELINQAASGAFAFHKIDKFDARGRHKVFALIRIVNKKLDELAAEILKQESDNIKMLNLVDDIRGMLVDLMM